MQLEKLQDHPVQLLPPPDVGVSDKKEYRNLQLPNGMKVLLISDYKRHGPATPPANPEDDTTCSGEDDAGTDDNESDSEEEQDYEEDEDSVSGDKSASQSPESKEYKAAASLAVSWGSCEDPFELQGLMHFLEHMVFMGSEKYPKENSFDDFIRRHGGNDNAYTDCEHTNFHFDVHEAYLWEALDRFSQFFVAPLMKKDSMERERKAVHSEFTMAEPSDSNRKSQLLSSLAVEGHPLSKFMWGNECSLSTQSDDAVYAKLHEFREKYYSAQYMSLAVQSRHTLDDMQENVTKIFSQIPNNNQMMKHVQETLSFPYPPNSINKLIKILPIKAKHSLTLTWFLPPMKFQYRRHPLRLIGRFLGHEAYGSILSFLKSKNWASELQSACESCDSEENSYCSVLQLLIQLTETGFHNVKEVLHAVFQYTAMLRHEYPSPELLQECQQLARLDVDFGVETEPMSNVEHLTAAMLVYSPQDHLTGDYLIFEYDEQLYRDTVNHLRPDTVNIILKSKLLGELDSSSVRTEPWFNTKYSIEDISDDWREVFASADTSFGDCFYLPRHNSFIPTIFSLLPPPPQGVVVPEYPRLLLKCPVKGLLYYKPDYTFQLPKTHIKIQFVYEDTAYKKDSKFVDVVQLLLLCLEYQLQEPAYDAACAKYTYSITNSYDGCELSVDGFTQNAQRFLELILSYLQNFGNKFNEDMFQAMKDLAVRKQFNRVIKPDVFRNQLRLHLLVENCDTSLQHVTSLMSVTPDDVLQCSKTLLDSCYVIMLVQGTMTEQQAVAAYECVQGFVKRDPGNIRHIPQPGYRKFKPGVSTLQVKTLNRSDGNSAIVNYYQGPPGDLRKQVLLDFVMIAMDEPCFDTLRTQEQLGYSVHCQGNESNGVLGFSIFVTPPASKFSTSFVDQRIESFLVKFESQLSMMKENSFATLRQTVLNMKKINYLALAEEVARNWNEIVRREFLFDRLQKQVELIPSVTLDEVLEFYRALIKPNSAQYRKLSVQVIGSASYGAHKAPEMAALIGKGMSAVEYLSEKSEKTANTASDTCDSYCISNCEEYLKQLQLMPVHYIL